MPAHHTQGCRSHAYKVCYEHIKHMIVRCMFVRCHYMYIKCKVTDHV